MIFILLLCFDGLIFTKLNVAALLIKEENALFVMRLHYWSVKYFIFGIKTTRA